MELNVMREPTTRARYAIGAMAEAEIETIMGPRGEIYLAGRDCRNVRSG